MWEGSCLKGRLGLARASPSYLLEQISVMASPIEIRLDVEDDIELAPVAGERASGAAESHEVSSPHLESVRLLHEKT